MIYRSCIFNAFNPEMIDRLKSKGKTGYTLYIKVYKTFFCHITSPHSTQHTLLKYPSDFTHYIPLCVGLAVSASPGLVWCIIVEKSSLLFISHRICSLFSHSLLILLLIAHLCRDKGGVGLRKLQMLGSGDRTTATTTTTSWHLTPFLYGILRPNV